MSYNSIAQCAGDLTFFGRLSAAYAKEGAVDPTAAAQQRRWTIAGDPSIEPAYESALAADNPNPGGDESVITDGALLAAVQAHPWPEAPA